jgi:hypothetical protein
VVFYTSANVPSFPLHVAAAIFAPGDTIDDVAIYNFAK